MTHHVNKNDIDTPAGSNNLSIPIQKINNDFNNNEVKLEKGIKDSKDAIFIRKFLSTISPSDFEDIFISFTDEMFTKLLADCKIIELALD